MKKYLLMNKCARLQVDFWKTADFCHVRMSKRLFPASRIFLPFVIFSELGRSKKVLLAMFRVLCENLS